VVGQEEVTASTVNVRTRDNVVHGSITVDTLINQLQQLTKQFK